MRSMSAQKTDTKQTQCCNKLDTFACNCRSSRGKHSDPRMQSVDGGKRVTTLNYETYANKIRVVFFNAGICPCFRSRQEDAKLSVRVVR